MSKASKGHAKKAEKKSKDLELERREETEKANGTFESVKQSGKGVLVTVAVKPNRKVDEILVVMQEFVEVSVKAPPTEGQANAAVAELLACTVGTAKSNVTLKRGGKSRSKVFFIDGATEAAVLSTLRAIAPSST